MIQRYLLLLILSIFLTFHLEAKTPAWVQRIDPTFWWTEMNSPELQIMLYGIDISKADISIDYQGVSISKK